VLNVLANDQFRARDIQIKNVTFTTSEEEN
jgi:hypothetical protein